MSWSAKAGGVGERETSTTHSVQTANPDSAMPTEIAILPQRCNLRGSFALDGNRRVIPGHGGGA